MREESALSGIGRRNSAHILVGQRKIEHVQIEKHSLEIEARLQEAEEQSQNEKRVEDKERMQKSQEVR